ncbi:2,3-butanediol dehydrogenase [Aerococcus suis]|nr:2,3-butanediol dehydrogenase [Aerococcus suis]
MRAARLYDNQDLRVENIDTPEVGAKDIKVRVAWTGICGSDLHEYNDGPLSIPKDGKQPLTGHSLPVTMGHEFSGVVEEVGSEVTKVAVGDRVAVNPLIVSGKNPDKLIDMYQGFTFVGLGADGGFADHVVVDESYAIKLTDNVDLEVAALVEPLSVSMQAVRESEIEFGDSVAIFGAGPIGLAQILAVKAAGARDVFVFDLSDERLEKAKEVGADYAINSGETDPVEFVRNLYPYGVDRSFEVAGVPQTLNQAIQLTRPRGMVTITSIFTHPIEFRVYSLTSTGVRLASSLGYEDDIFALTVKMIETGQIDPSPLITDRIELEDIVDKGFKELQNNKRQAKILVKLSGEH